MRWLLPAVLFAASLTGCGTIQHADQQAGYSYRTEMRERNKTARARQKSSDAVRLAAINGASAVTVRPSAERFPCHGLSAQDEEFKRLCEDHTEGSGDINDEREAVCGPLRAALDQLRDSCQNGDNDGETEVVFSPIPPSSAGVNINLTGASTGDIRFIIQSPGAADQSANGVEDVQPAAPPESVIAGMSNGVMGFLGNIAPWAIGGYAISQIADAVGDGMRNAGDRDNSTDQSVNIDQSVGGDKISQPAAEEPAAEEPAAEEPAEE